MRKITLDQLDDAIRQARYDRYLKKERGEGDLATLYMVKDIAEIFDICKKNAYALMASDGFPSFRLGRRSYVQSDALEQWASEQLRVRKAFRY